MTTTNGMVIEHRKTERTNQNIFFPFICVVDEKMIILWIEYKEETKRKKRTLNDSNIERLAFFKFLNRTGWPVGRACCSP